jgi:L-serine dehydratase
LAIWQIALENEKSWHGEEETREYIRRIWGVMQACAKRRLGAEPILFGGLQVRRRAPNLAKKTSAQAGVPTRSLRWTRTVVKSYG